MGLRIEQETDVAMLHAPVGGGHLTFLVSLQGELHAMGKQTQVLDPIVSGNAVTRAIWERFRNGYETGSTAGALQTVYEAVRSHAHLFHPLIGLAKSELVSALNGFGGHIVADHAYVAPGKGFLIQGDVRTESLYADKKSTVFVPVSESVQQLVYEFGHPQEKVKEVGFLIPGSIINPKRRDERKMRLKNGAVHIGFFGTGASPPQHYRLFEETILPGLVRERLFQGGIKNGKAKLTVYTFTNQTKAEHIAFRARQLGLTVTKNHDDHPDANWDVRVLWGKDPYEAVSRCIEAAEDIDYLVSMMGERAGWLHDMPASALPPIGVNAPHNTDYLFRHGIIKPVGETEQFPAYIAEQLASGAPDAIDRLNRGTDILPVDGAKHAARIIFSR